MKENMRNLSLTPTSKTSTTASRTISRTGRIRIKTTGVAEKAARRSGWRNFEDLEDIFQDGDKKDGNSDDRSDESAKFMVQNKKGNEVKVPGAVGCSGC
ncbi:hypothetical protein L5515_008873 [Caenorhabditis briggsae]|uniref:Uncharacterized protein n=1 Tax=Caenorhabditis briggsae TaxID=6238 RepID=A0AAE9F6P1_CAEBR|nr:hypothetical protein L5515_008873 [Caenorhabditis briggsae]